jgi:transposase
VMRNGRGCSLCCRGNPRRGHRWNDHRLVINGIFFRTRTGCPRRDLPECFGNWKTVYNRHRRRGSRAARHVEMMATCR